MLKTLRKGASSWMIKALFWILVLAFVSWGGGGLDDFINDQSNLIAKINDIPIKRQEYESKVMLSLRNYREQWKNILKKDITEDQEREFKMNFLENMIENELLTQTAKNLNIGSADGQVREYIKGLEYFKDEKTKTFSFEKYSRLLRYNNLTPTTFEKDQKSELTIKTLEDIIKGFSKITSDELEYNFKSKNEQVDVNFIKFDPENFINKVTLKDEQIKDFYEKNKEKYVSKEKRDIRYVILNVSDFEKLVKPVSEAEILKEFNDNFKANNSQKEKVKAQHILLKSDSIEKSQEEAIQKKAKDLYERAKTGEDFAKLAETNSQDEVSAKKGGDLGFFERGEMVKAFEDKAFSMKAGEISEPIKSTFGYHIIKVNERQEAKEAKLEDFKDKIIKELAVKKLDSLMNNKIEELKLKFKNKDFKEVLENENYKVETLTDLSRDSKIESIKDYFSVVTTAFSLRDPEGKFDSVKDSSGNYFLMELVKIKAPEQLTFEIAKEEIQKDVKLEEAKKIAKLEADKFLEELKKTINKPSELATKNNLVIESTGNFKKSRSNYVPKIGYAPQLIKKAFEVTEQNPVVDTVIGAGDKFYCVFFKSHEKADMEKFKTEKASLISSLQNEFQEIYLSNWKNSLKSNSKIEKYLTLPVKTN